MNIPSKNGVMEVGSKWGAGTKIWKSIKVCHWIGPKITQELCSIFRSLWRHRLLKIDSGSQNITKFKLPERKFRIGPYFLITSVTSQLLAVSLKATRSWISVLATCRIYLFSIIKSRLNWKSILAYKSLFANVKFPLILPTKVCHTAGRRSHWVLDYDKNKKSGRG